MTRSKCLVVVNHHSGSWRPDIEERVRQALPQYALTFADVDDPLPDTDTLGAMAVCGGDGTLHNFLNRVKGSPLPLYYFPTGTLNERARIGDASPVVGRINDDYFVYVVAAGSFTPIGYTPAEAQKKRWKWWAYLVEALREYRVHRIAATVSVDGHCYQGTYTLIMALRSPRCFLFRFNRMYRPDADSIHLLLIDAPARDDLWGRLAIFPPLFRAFFVGFGHEVHGRHLLFVEGRQAVVHFDTGTVCNVDGERRDMMGTYRLSATHPTPSVQVCRIPKAKAPRHCHRTK